MQRRCHYNNCSFDSLFPEEEEEDLTFLEACMDCDEDAVYDMIQDGMTVEQVNERDRSGRIDKTPAEEACEAIYKINCADCDGFCIGESGRNLSTRMAGVDESSLGTGISHASANGFLPVVELLGELEEVNINLPDNEGNNPLIFAAQAGHSEVVSYLLHHFRGVRVDQINHLGFSALIKAAIQGRTRCCKQLLFAGASPKLRDHGRGFCAEEWARFCGRKACADAISKWIRSKKYYLAKILLPKDKWASEPSLVADKDSSAKGIHGFLQKYLHRKSHNNNTNSGLISNSKSSPLFHAARCASTPIIPSLTSPPESPTVYRRPSCLDDVVVKNIPKLTISQPSETNEMNETQKKIVKIKPPKILKTDYDEAQSEVNVT